MRLRCLGGFFILLMFTASSPCSFARQDSTDLTNFPPGATKEEKLATVKLEMTNAINRVCEIVNRPVKAYVRQGDIDVSIYSPGWFHPGASKPDFNTVDVRQTQELPYAAHKFVSSDLNPGIVFLGQDLEFNSMTKYFYTNRTVPKRKLTDAEMQEINRLYRVIGKCEQQILEIKAPPENQAAQSGKTGDTEEVIPGQSFESIRSIPRRTRAIYAGIGIGVLLLLVIVMRVVRKRPG
ncbi:MAG TPA: hypothetical protein VG754_03275 [Verrucomicrobiae bacterium]|nr:hypothetical protein [Verrucomicrobiae bacterium]